MFNFFKKNPEVISRTTPGYEEAERRTPTTGVILLILMFIAGILEVLGGETVLGIFLMVMSLISFFVRAYFVKKLKKD